MHRSSRPQRWIGVVGACLLVATVGAVPAGAAQVEPPPPGEPSGPPDDELGPISPGPKDGPARLDPSLLAATTPSVTVEIVHDPGPGAADEVIDAVGRVGGEITGAVPGFLVQADVPVAALVEVAASSGVRLVRPPIDAAVIPDAGAALPDAGPTGSGEHVATQWVPGAATQATPGSVVGEHLAHVGAPAWHANGWTGTGIKVGIVDIFSSDLWTAAQATGDLPAPAGTFCRIKGSDCGSPFVANPNLKHGNGVAEIIHDLVPDAALYVAYAETASDLQATVDWFHASGVHVISRSLGSLLDGPGDGTGPLDSVAASAVAKGIPFVNSAGNHANRGGRPGGYWRSAWVDQDLDGWLDFPNGSEFIRITCGGLFQGFRWSDWGANPTDYDVWVFDNAGNNVWRLELPQGAGVPPIEGVDGSEPQWCPAAAGTRWLAVLRYAPGNGTSGDQLEIFMNLASVQFPQTPFSAGQPIADSATRGVVSVGAVDPVGGNTIGAYSSAGPTNDGRIKPDISAPSAISTTAYGSQGFSGTSAAAPVAAGVAALYLDAGLASTPTQVHDLLVGRAVDLGPGGADYDFGYGEIRLGSTPAPAPPPAPPATGAFVPLTPARVLDTRSGNGASPGLVGPGGVVDVQITGRGGVPASGVAAVALNVTITEAAGPGFVQALPSGQGTLGSSSNLNAEYGGQTIPNAVIVPVGANGGVTLYSQSGGHLLADVLGYFVPAAVSGAGRFQEVAPSRLLDTRTGHGSPIGVVPLPGGSSMPLQVTGRGGVPAAGVSAVILNVTATFPQGPGFVQVVPTGGPTALGASSNLNVETFQTIPNLVIVPVGGGGTVTLYSSTTTHLIADVMGWFTDASASPASTGLFLPRTPQRYFDTRSDPGLTKMAPGSVVYICTAADVRGAIFNVTATETDAPGFVQVVPANVVALGSTSNLNIEFVDQTIPNAVVTGVGVDSRCPGGGAIYNYTHAGTHLLADLFGVFVT